MNVNKLFFCLILVLGLLTSQCTKEDSVSPPTSSGPGANSGGPPPTPSWLIPQNAVYDGGPGKDGIAAISEPRFIAAEAATFLNDNELILGIRVGEEVRAYPHRILDWHEIVNDVIEDRYLSITYCPLTGTGTAWDRELNPGLSTFGVSGLLYNTNLIPYDRLTDSNWSQMLLKCVNGELAGTRITTYPLLETTWGSWKELFPDTKVMSTETGYNFGYTRYPYGDYRTNHNTLFFPVAVEDNRLPWKERVLGVMAAIDDPKAYRFERFPESGVGVIHDKYRDHRIVVAGSREKNFMVAFKPELEDGTELEFRALENVLPLIMEDQEGNQWDVFGRAVAGPRAGAQLESYDSFIGFWVAWGAFYPELRYY